LQLTRTPYLLPKLTIKQQPMDIFSYQFTDFIIENYQTHPHIKAQVAV
ncbi:MAG: thymidylate synthase, partial [Candidatus Marithrix sp.]|nr:thymidylate synthase [Candidatus Marithrix sp.]